MKAIQTEYKGYLFRSRLEARWAVYFDSLGINWEYEFEGFEGNGVRYLPDFYLPDNDIYIEIKPNGHDDKDLYKWKEFGKEDRILILLEGMPNCYSCRIFGVKGVTRITPFANLVKSSYGFMWHDYNDFSNVEPFKSAIINAKQARF